MVAWSSDDVGVEVNWERSADRATLSAFSRFFRAASSASVLLLALGNIVSHPLFHALLIIDKERDEAGARQGVLEGEISRPKSWLMSHEKSAFTSKGFKI
jgi:hypothetical protein